MVVLSRVSGNAYIWLFFNRQRNRSLIGRLLCSIWRNHILKLWAFRLYSHGRYLRCWCWHGIKTHHPCTSSSISGQQQQQLWRYPIRVRMKRRSRAMPRCGSNLEVKQCMYGTDNDLVSLRACYYVCQLFVILSFAFSNFLIWEL